MSRTRRARVRLALFSLLSLLFMQLSVAAYACSGIEASIGGGHATQAPADATGGCEGMDEEQPSLCHAHCHGQSVTADVSVPTPLALPGIDPFATALAAAALRPTLQVHSAAPDVVAYTGAPSIPLLHCCFRN